MASTIQEFLEALDRLTSKGVKPTLDGVAIEAGRKKGSIRRGLSRHKDIVVAINEAADQFGNEVKKSKEFKLAAQLKRTKEERDQYKEQYNTLLARVLGYIYQIEEQRIEIIELHEKLRDNASKKKAAGTLINIVK